MRRPGLTAAARTLALTLGATAAAWPAPGLASRGGPDEDGYTWVDSREPDGPAFEWLYAPYALHLGEEDWAEVDLPFPFPYRGEVYETVIVGADGTLSFAGHQPGWQVSCPLGDAAGPVIAPMWSDLRPRDGSMWAGEVVDADGSAFVVEWFRVGRYAGTGTVTFEAVLRPDGTIEFRYADTAFSDDGLDPEDFGGAAAIGAGAAGISLQSSCFWPALEDAYAIRIAPPSDCPDLDGDGVAACAGDCQDWEPDVHPGAAERCNGIDDDCDGHLAEGEGDADGDGLLACASDGASTCPPLPSRVALIQDVPPWGTDRIAALLDATAVPYDVVTAEGLPDFDPAPYDRVIVAGDQSQALYDALPSAWSRLEEWAGRDRCHTLVVLATDGARSGGVASAWPAGLETVASETSALDAPDPASPWLAHPFGPDLDRAARALHAADRAFASVPEGAQVLLSNPEGRAVLALVPLGAGGLLATTLNAEFLETYGYSPVLASLALGPAVRAHEAVPDCDDTNPAIGAGAPEACDGVDNDCDGEVDEDFDGDGDGRGACQDCDDADPSIHPGAAEACDGVDQDCDGVADEGWDQDHDGHTRCAGDCDDGDPGSHPGATEICDGVDQDCDGEVDEGLDGDGDGHTACDGDCDDADPAVHPGAAEACDGVDQDCDGAADDAPDADGDGLGPCDGDCDDADPAVHAGASEGCDGLDSDCDGALPADEIDSDQDGLSPCQGDCDDARASVHPGASEGCDGLDSDCDGALPADEIDSDQDGLSPCQGDCDDTRASVHPGAQEVPNNGLDDDCQDGDLLDGDGDGFLPPEAAGADCLDSDPEVKPGAKEAPNGIDDDCDGAVDEGTEWSDDDGDGFTEEAGDCDDADPNRRPGAAEQPNGIDDDCDGTVDEGTPARDDDGDGFAEDAGDCDDADPARAPRALERANGLDDDCDGAIDEGTAASDGDGDGFSAEAGDCDDADPGAYPGAPEAPDGRDQDCDGAADEGTAAADDDGDGLSEEAGDCDDADPFAHPGAMDLCGDGADQDCDGIADGDCDGGPARSLGMAGPAGVEVSGCSTAAGGSTGSWLALALSAPLLARRRRIALAAAWALVAVAGCAAPPAEPGSEAAVVVEGSGRTFPIVRPGGSSEIEVEVWNAGEGAADLRIGIAPEAGSEGAFHLASPDTPTVLPGASATVRLRYTPPAEGDHRALLLVDGGDGAPELLLLQGACRGGRLSAVPLPATVGTDGSPEVQVRILNDAIAPARIAALAIEPAHAGWSVEPAGGATVAAGGDLTVIVRGPPTPTRLATLVVDVEGEEPIEIPLSTLACAAADGPVDADRDGAATCAGDCDDADPAVRPGATEAANGIDDDCDGAVDEGTHARDDDGDGLSELQGDCLDGDPSVHPGATEKANGVDDDCDGTVDEGTERFDDDGDGFTEVGGDPDDTDPALRPR